MTFDMLTALAEKNTVVDTPRVDPNNKTGTYPLGVWSFITDKGVILPAWGTQAREIALRGFYRNEYNTLIQAVIAGLANKIAATQWEITGDKKYTLRTVSPDGEATTETAVEYFQRVFRNAQFGEGWSGFVKRWVTEYLRHDRGAYIEMQAPGDPLEAPIAAPTGLAVLDSLRCYNTGDPLYPVVYWSRLGTMHIMSATRVIHHADMPDTDERYPGVGLCALSRSIGVAQRQILMGRYIENYLSDTPKPGILAVSGMATNQWDATIAKFAATQRNDITPVFGQTMVLHGLDPNNPIDVKPIPFSQAPEKFDFQVYVNIDAKEIAAAFNIDIQEFWELTGGSLGSGAQSKVMHSKSQGKMLANLYSTLERALNDVLPEELEFRFKPKDSELDADEAAGISQYATVIPNLLQIMSRDEVRRFLADKVEAVAAAITDGAGNVVAYNDVDVQPVQRIIAPDTTPVVPLTSTAVPAAPPPTTTKDYADTRAAWVRSFEGLVFDAVKGKDTSPLRRRVFGSLLRQELRRAGEQAYTDGLREGGVTDALTEFDTANIQHIFISQSEYVTAFADEVFTDGLTPDAISARAQTWANKSLNAFYVAGLVRANRNQRYQWVLGKTEQHCTDCLRLNGQVHRMSQWYARGWLPHADRLDCGGWRCDCSLIKTDEPAQGRF